MSFAYFIVIVKSRVIDLRRISMSQKIEQFRDILEESQKLTFFGGAGVSTASGIPDFRSSKGILVQDSGHTATPEEIISHSFAVANPETFFDFYFDKMVHDEAEPNDAHKFLVHLESNLDKDVSIITQNIDGLHEKAGSSQVYDLHGSIWKNYCTKCGRFYRIDELEKDQDGIPRCVDDGGIVRPDVTLYEEQLDSGTLQGAVQSIQEADTLIVAGTSLAVYPAAGLLDYFSGDNIVVVNKSAIQTNRSDALTFEADISEIFSQLY